MKISGGCLCGKVHYRGEAEPVFSVKCYCTDCRKTSGAGHAALMGFPKSAIHIDGPVQGYGSKADSGSDVTRGFCPTCGAGIYSHNTSIPDLLFLRVSTFDDVSVFKPQLAVYASRAPAWDPVSDALPAFALMPPHNR